MVVDEAITRHCLITSTKGFKWEKKKEGNLQNPVHRNQVQEDQAHNQTYIGGLDETTTVYMLNKL